MDKKIVFKEILIQSIQFVLFYFVAKFFWGSEQWYQDKVKEMEFFLAASVVFILIRIILNSVGSPIIMELKQMNKQFESSQTNFFLHGRNKTTEYERTVRARIQLKRKYSIWGWLVLRLLKNIEYKMNIEPDSNGLKLQLVNDINLHYPNSIVSSTANGIEIDVGKYIRSTLINTDQCQVFKEIEYIVIEDRNNFATSGSFVIYPKVKVKGIKSKALEIFIVSKIEQHIVNFVRR